MYRKCTSYNALFGFNLKNDLIMTQLKCDLNANSLTDHALSESRQRTLHEI